MFSSLLAGSVVALSVGQTYAAGYAWSGVNLGGFDFGCTTNGSCVLEDIVPPLHQYKGQDGAGQMKHFVEDDGLNAFRLPVAWQYLVNDNCGGDLDETAMTKYDALVQACLDTGAFCIIDIHNYGRWDGEIIGQGGPPDKDFASLWSQLAKKYANEAKVVMGMINEPHDIPDLTLWAGTVQAAVTAIREAGATEHTILLPGTGYTSAETFVSSGSAKALSKITNLDGSITNLVFDVHKYLDSDNSGTHTECTGNDIKNAFEPLAKWLRQENRQAILSEIGGGSAAASCIRDICAVADFLNENSDVYLGILGWAAGSFDDTYILTLSPTEDGGTWTDKPLLTKCFAEKFQGGVGVTTPSNSTSGGDPATGVSSTSAAAEEPANSETLPNLTGTTAAQTVGPETTAAAAVPASSPSADAGGVGGGYNNFGGGDVAAPTTTPSSSSPTSELSGGNSPIPVGGPSSWGSLNSSTVAVPTGSGAAAPIMTTTPMIGYEPTTLQTVIVSTSAGAAASDTPTSGQPTTEQPAAGQPAAEQPTTEQPTTQQPTTEQPPTEQPTTQQPATEQPTTEDEDDECEWDQTGDEKTNAALPATTTAPMVGSPPTTLQTVVVSTPAAVVSTSTTAAAAAGMTGAPGIVEGGAAEGEEDCEWVEDDEV